MSNPLNYRASSSAMYYTPSRRIVPGRAAVGLLVAVALAVVGGFAYGKLQPHVTNVYLRIGQVIVGAIAIGVIGAEPVDSARCACRSWRHSSARRSR